eukprot:1392253-Rhodomonas_salina.3
MWTSHVFLRHRSAPAQAAPTHPPSPGENHKKKTANLVPAVGVFFVEFAWRAAKSNSRRCLHGATRPEIVVVGI